MKLQAQKQTMECSGLRWQRRFGLICVSAAMWFFVLSAQAATDLVRSPKGGPGGTPFVARCPQGQYLIGFELRAGDAVDAIRPICASIYGPTETGPLEPFPSKFGGEGGVPTQLLCPKDYPIVEDIEIRAEGDPFVVNEIKLNCVIAVDGNTRDHQFPPPTFSGSDLLFGWKVKDSADCTASSYADYNANYLAVGITGRSGERLDALGLICNALELTPRPVALGRVQSTTPASPLRVIDGEPPICARARDSRARNSPIASALQAQCEAARRAAPPPVTNPLHRLKASPLRGGLRVPAPAVSTPSPQPPEPAGSER